MPNLESLQWKRFIHLMGWIRVMPPIPKSIQFHWTQIACKVGCRLYSRTSFFYKCKTSTLTPFVKPRDILTLGKWNVFYIQLYVEFAFMYNPGSTSNLRCQALYINVCKISVEPEVQKKLIKSYPYFSPSSLRNLTNRNLSLDHCIRPTTYSSLWPKWCREWQFEIKYLSCT